MSFSWRKAIPSLGCFCTCWEWWSPRSSPQSRRLVVVEEVVGTETGTEEDMEVGTGGYHVQGVLGVLGVHRRGVQGDESASVWWWSW